MIQDRKACLTTPASPWVDFTIHLSHIRARKNGRRRRRRRVEESGLCRRTHSAKLNSPMRGPGSSAGRASAIYLVSIRLCKAFYNLPSIVPTTLDVLILASMNARSAATLAAVVPQLLATARSSLRSPMPLQSRQTPRTRPKVSAVEISERYEMESTIAALRQLRQKSLRFDALRKKVLDMLGSRAIQATVSPLSQACLTLQPRQPMSRSDA